MCLSDQTESQGLKYSFVFASEKKAFALSWNNFIKTSEQVTWRYLPQWREFQSEYVGESLLKDLSFVVMDANFEPVAICPLFLEKVKTYKQFSSAFDYQPGPLIRMKTTGKQREKVESLCFKKIDDLAQEHAVAKALVMADPLGGVCKHNIFTKYGFWDATLSSVLIDFSLPQKVIWSRLRKSSQSLINKALKSYQIKIYDYQNADHQIHELYREMHHRAAGRITRPKRTFDLQLEMLKEDQAMLIGAEYKGQWVAFDYFFHYNGHAYYGSAADDPEIMLKHPVGHALIWCAIIYYLNRNFACLDMGIQQFGPQWFDHPSPKDISISFFKRGFGGEMRSTYRGIKYYDQEILETDMQHSVDRIKSMGQGLEPND